MKLDIKAKIREHAVWLASGGEKGQRLRLSGLDLRLYAAEIAELMNEQPLKLDRADLSYVNMNGMSLHRLSFKEANLAGANLSYTRLNGSDLTGANFENTLFYGTDVSGARMSRELSFFIYAQNKQRKA